MDKTIVLTTFFRAIDGFCFPSANMAKADMYAVIVLRRVVRPVKVCRLSIQS